MLKIYKASAGSGKTYTLAFEYIQMLVSVKDTDTGARYLNHPGYIPGGRPVSNLHRHILAITFTNKATEEMKRRIIKELDLLASAPAAEAEERSNYAPTFMSDLKCSRTDLADTAGRALRQLLCDYNNFHVGTIDSFFQRVLRTFARELDRQGDFSVEINSNTVVSKSVGAMLDEFNIDMDRVPGLERWIDSYLSKNINEGHKTNFFNRSSQMHMDLIRFVEHICDESFKPYLEDMRRFFGENGVGAAKIGNLKKELDKIVDTQFEKLKAKAAETLDIINEDGVINKLKGTYKIPSYIEGYFLLGELPPSAPGKPWYGKSGPQYAINCDPGLFNKGNRATDEHYAALSGLFSFAVGIDVLRKDISIINTSLTQLILLSHAWRFIDAFIAENNTVLLSDTNHLISRILGGDDTPFVYERMGVELKHFLIDEFQDTSKMQWQNLKPLVANSMAERHDNLIIGDEKQSIYRFRNSDSSLLRTQVADSDFPAPRFDTRIFGKGEGENTNYRSAREIVQFNNTLFTLLASEWGVDGYGNVVQTVKHRNRDGYVHFIPFNKPQKGESASEETPSADIEEMMLDSMARNILRQHDTCGYPWRDIAILIDTNKHGARVIEFLTDKYPQIPVISSEALFLRKSSAVRTIVDILKLFAYETAPRKARTDSARGNRYPSEAETAVIISRYRYYRTSGCDHHEAIDKALADYDNSGGGISAVSESLRREHPSTLIALIETVIKQCLTDEERLSQCAYIAAFQDFAIEYCRNFNPSVKAFLDTWEVRKGTLSVVASAGVDAVTLLTIHKSKGLEFECVNIPFGSWSECNNKFEQWIPFPEIGGLNPESCPPALYVAMGPDCDRPASMFNSHYSRNIGESREDRLNMTYVAYTRAGAELIVYYEPGKDIGNSLVKAFSSALPGHLADNPDTIDIASHFNAETGELEIGTPMEKRNTDDSKSTESEPSAYNVHTANATKILTRVEDMLGLDADITADSNPGAPENSDYVDDEARRRGIILHDIFSLMPEADDLDRAIALASTLHHIDPDDAADLRMAIAEMLERGGERTRRWFDGSGRVLNEQTIYSPELGDRRLDRLVLYPDGSADIVDYKFTSRTNPRHRRQVAEYITMVSDLGYSPVRATLWYPLLNEIIDV